MGVEQSVGLLVDFNTEAAVVDGGGLVPHVVLDNINARIISVEGLSGNRGGGVKSPAPCLEGHRVRRRAWRVTSLLISATTF